VRVTRLDPAGNPLPGPNNVYVTDKPMMLTVTPDIEAGADRTLTGGCDCIIATYRGFDKLKRFTFEFDLGVLEPALMEMLLGSTAITVSGDVRGQWWSLNSFDCSVQTQPNVCFEGWQTAWDGSGPAAALPYVHWIWPGTHWQIAAHTLQNDFNQPKVTGYSEGNTAWGTGIFGDLPEAAQPLGGFFFTATVPPAASCGYQTHTIT
jgi:hypothetical protein